MALSIRKYDTCEKRLNDLVTKLQFHACALTTNNQGDKADLSRNETVIRQMLDEIKDHNASMTEHDRKKGQAKISLVRLFD